MIETDVTLVRIQVKEKFPNEYKAREQDKLRYRYPRGESYMDVLSRYVPPLPSTLSCPPLSPHPHTFFRAGWSP
jgi:hypothetical protein